MHYQILLCLLFSIFSMGMGNTQVYNQFFEKQDDVTFKEYVASLETRVVQQRSKIEKSSIIEIFEQGTGRFLGFKVSSEDFDLAMVPYLKHEDIKYLLEDYSPPVSVAIFQQIILPGMTAEEAILSWGKPNRIDENDEGQIIRYDRGVILLKDGKVVSHEIYYD